MAFSYDQICLQLYQIVIAILSLLGTAIEVITSFATAVSTELTSLIARVEVARDFPNGFPSRGPAWETLWMPLSHTAITNISHMSSVLSFQEDVKKVTVV